MKLKKLLLGTLAACCVTSMAFGLAACKQGATGPQGEKGDKGDTGAPGAVGAPGAAGKDGSAWHSGNTAPAADVGNVGDFYLDTATNDVYVKTADGWGTPVTNLTGAAGAAGSNGAAGAAGAAGDKGDKGDAGDKGDKGDTGVGIVSTELDSYGDLVVTYSDESTVTVALPHTYSVTVPDDFAYMLDGERAQLLLVSEDEDGSKVTTSAHSILAALNDTYVIMYDVYDADYTLTYKLVDEEGTEYLFDLPEVQLNKYSREFTYDALVSAPGYTSVYLSENSSATALLLSEMNSLYKLSINTPMTKYNVSITIDGETYTYNSKIGAREVFLSMGFHTVYVSTDVEIYDIISAPIAKLKDDISTTLSYDYMSGELLPQYMGTLSVSEEEAGDYVVYLSAPSKERSASLAAASSTLTIDGDCVYIEGGTAIVTLDEGDHAIEFLSECADVNSFKFVPAGTKIDGSTTVSVDAKNAMFGIPYYFASEKGGSYTVKATATEGQVVYVLVDGVAVLEAADATYDFNLCYGGVIQFFVAHPDGDKAAACTLTISEGNALTEGVNFIGKDEGTYKFKADHDGKYAITSDSCYLWATEAAYTADTTWSNSVGSPMKAYVVTLEAGVNASFFVAANTGFGSVRLYITDVTSTLAAGDNAVKDGETYTFTAPVSGTYHIVLGKTDKASVWENEEAWSPYLDATDEYLDTYYEFFLKEGETATFFVQSEDEESSAFTLTVVSGPYGEAIDYDEAVEVELEAGEAYIGVLPIDDADDYDLVVGLPLGADFDELDATEAGIIPVIVVFSAPVVYDEEFEMFTTVAVLFLDETTTFKYLKLEVSDKDLANGPITMKIFAGVVDNEEEPNEFEGALSLEVSIEAPFVSPEPPVPSYEEMTVGENTPTSGTGIFTFTASAEGYITISVANTTTKFSLSVRTSPDPEDLNTVFIKTFDDEEKVYSAVLKVSEGATYAIAYYDDNDTHTVITVAEGGEETGAIVPVEMSTPIQPR